MHPRKSVCLITGGYTARNLRLQPWRYLSEVALQLAEQDHCVTVVTDGEPGSEETASLGTSNVVVRRVPSVNRFRWRSNPPLESIVRESNPDVILWHLGLPSFIHQELNSWQGIPTVGIFPGLVYRPNELLRLGVRRIARGYHLSAMHVLGTIVPKQLMRQTVDDGRLVSLVVQTKTTCQRLVESGLQPDQVKVIPPGVDEVWNPATVNGCSDVRSGLGYEVSDVVVLYFGSPAPLRGLHTLIRALGIARNRDTGFKLLVLNRRRRDELEREDAELRRLLNDNDVGPHVKVISGFLSPEELTQYVAASDIVALPFELVPADAPLSLLEAQALGKPVVTTRVACLPELVESGDGYIAEPADPQSLAQVLHQAVSDLRATANGERRQTKRPHPRSWQQVGEEWSQFIQSL